MNTTEKIFLGFSITALLSSVAYAIFGKRIHSKITERKNSKLIEFTKTVNAEGSLSISVPLINKAYYKANEKSAIKSKLDTIYGKYKSFIDLAAKLNNVSTALIKSFIFIESAGNENAANGNAIGLMQVDFNSVTDIITRERKSGKLTEQEKLIIKKHIGQARYDKVMKAAMGEIHFTKADMLKPELNIIIGSMYLSQCIAKEKGRIDRAAIRYNLGYFTKSIPEGDTKTIIDSPKLRQISKDYVLKLGGVNGTLDILV